MKLDVLLSVKGIQCLRKVSPFRHKIWDITYFFHIILLRKEKQRIYKNVFDRDTT